jgi:tetratricopeptide (TPR) repeat protein
MLTKEFAITLPVMIGLADFLLEKRTRTGGTRWRLLPFLLALPVIPLLVFLHRSYPCYNDSGQIEWAKKAGFVDTVAPGHGESPRTYLLTQPRVFLTYLRLVFFPAKQRVEYAYNKNISFFQTSSFLPSLLILSLVIFALARRRNIFIIPFGILWFIVTLIPESSVIPILDLAVEHRLYLPLAGAAILAGSFLESIASRGRAAFPFAFAALFLFSLLTYNRNLVWHDPITLWEDNAAKAEGKARIHGNLGKAYLDAGRFEKAAREFKRMIELDPTFVGAYNNLAVIYIDHLKDYEEAKKYIALSLSLFPDYPAGYLNLGVIYLNTRQLKLAIENFKKVLDLDPKNLLAHYNLAACYVNLGDFTRAEEYLRRGLSFWPEEARFYVLLARIYQERGDAAKAREFGEQARSLGGATPGTD